jgi:hypothetical protein
MLQSGPFEVAVVTQRVTPAGAIVAGEYDQVREFVRCGGVWVGSLGTVLGGSLGGSLGSLGTVLAGSLDREPGDSPCKF